MAQIPHQHPAVLTRFLEPLGRCLTPEVAKELVNVRADPSVQARLEELADKHTEGALTPEERDEYATYVRAPSNASPFCKPKHVPPWLAMADEALRALVRQRTA